MSYPGAPNTFPELHVTKHFDLILHDNPINVDDITENNLQNVKMNITINLWSGAWDEASHPILVSTSLKVDPFMTFADLKTQLRRDNHTHLSDDQFIFSSVQRPVAGNHEAYDKSCALMDAGINPGDTLYAVPRPNSESNYMNPAFY